MMMICGLLAADSGEVRLDGQRLDRMRPGSRQQMGVVPQDLAIYPDLTARENLMFFGSLYHLSGAKLRQKVNDALERVGLIGRAGRFYRDVFGRDETPIEFCGRCSA